MELKSDVGKKALAIPVHMCWSVTNCKLDLKKKIDITLVVDVIFAFLFALLPILSHYKGPVVNAAVTVVSIILPYALFKIIRLRFLSIKTFKLLMPLALFWFFKIVDHGTSLIEVSQVFVYIVFFIVFATGCIRPKLLINAAIGISCAASICVVIQYICYYLFGFHLQLAPTGSLLENSLQWKLFAQTGIISITGRYIGFYRPSAFFLEPSHMFIYLCAPLFYELLSPEFGETEKRISILLSVGMLLSTSGMGIVATVIVWSLFLVKRRALGGRLSLRGVFRLRNIMLLLGLFVFLYFLYLNLDFFSRSVDRIFFDGSDYKNAVSGRVEDGTEFILQMRGLDLLIGIADHYSGLDFHMTGFNATMYKYGIIGTVLSYVFYVRCVRDLKNRYFWLAIVLIGASFFMPHTHGTFYMPFLVVFLLEGYRELEEQTTAQHTRL